MWEDLQAAAIDPAGARQTPNGTPGTFLTPEELDRKLAQYRAGVPVPAEILAAYAAGVPATVLAERCGLAAKTIRRHAKLLGATPALLERKGQPTPLRGEGWSYKRLADFFGLGTTAVRFFDQHHCAE
jgi:hypothetical protein